MSDTTLTPPCVLCGAPGLMGVGTVDGTEAEVWYCADHLGAGKVHAAQPVADRSAVEARRGWWARLVPRRA